MNTKESVCMCMGHPDYDAVTFLYCKKCGKKIVYPDQVSLCGSDGCTSKVGVTDTFGEHKIWRCKHFVYCPFCMWRCKNIDELEKHLKAYDSDSHLLCNGHFYYGKYAVENVFAEIKYYWLCEKGKVKT